MTTAIPPEDLDPPNDITEESVQDLAIPNDITEKSVIDISVPNNISEESVEDIAIPNEITDIPVSPVATPNNIAEVAVTPVSIPNDIAENPVVDVDIPTDLTEIAVEDIDIPNAITEVVIDDIAIPNVIAPNAPQDLAAPNELTEIAITPVSIPNSITDIPVVDLDAPNNITEVAIDDISVPNDITENAVIDLAVPNSLTEIAVTDLAVPNEITDIPVVDIAVPNSVPEIPVVPVSIPNAISENAVIDIDVPNSLTEIAVSDIAVPNDITEIAVTDLAVPNVIPEIDVSPFPRSITPLVQMDFASGQYRQNGQAITFEDLFTYSRATSASFINRRIASNGGYEYFIDTDFVGDVENLATFSENFEHSDWSKIQSIILTNAGRNSDGNSKARKLIGTSSDNLHYISQAIATAANVNVSVEAKADGYDWVSLQVFGTIANTTAWFNIKSGIVGSQSGAMTNAKIEPLDNGWFRCSATAEQASGTSFRIILSNEDGSTNFLDNGVDGILISKYQAALGDKVKPYVRTISSEVTKSFSESIRQEFLPETGENLGVLVEGASTNLFLRSEEFDNASWTKSSSSITANNAEFLDGTKSADKFEAGSTASITPQISQAVTVSSSDDYTSSIYVKASLSSVFIQIRYAGGEVANDPRANFDIVNGVLGTVDADITASIKDMGNGWFKCSTKVEADTTTLTTVAVLIKSASDTINQANSWIVGQGLHIGGAQCEEGEPTSYIHTTNATASRVADDLKIPTIGNTPNSILYSMSAKYKVNDIPTTTFGWIYQSNTLSGLDQMRISNSFAQVSAFRGSAVTSGANSNLMSSTIVAEDSKILNLYINGEFAVGGITILTDLEIDFTGFIHIGRDNSANNDFYLNGHIKSMSIYDKALTALEVASL